ncbi:MAG: YoaK family protein [Gammaproteobacteria bacterium]|jgi:uncharacterized membrane protein YoaK (UPF0700 family)
MIRQLPRWVWLGVFILPLSAGMVNAVAYLAFTHDAVSHVTGNTTRLAISLQHRDLGEALGLTGIIAAFLGGAVISGLIVGNERLRLGRPYGVALMVESLLLSLAYLLFSQGFTAGEYCAAAACGLQNAMVATYSGSVIRTTHLTGVVSDIGAWIGGFLRGHRQDRWQLTLLTTVFAGFLTGGLVGALAFASLRFMTLLVPAGLCLTVGTAYVWYRSLHPAGLPGEEVAVRQAG